MPSLFADLRSRVIGVVAGVAIAGSAPAIDEVRLLIPAATGSAWDVTARELGKAMLSAGVVKNIRYENRDGGEGAVGLAQFREWAKGDPGFLMLGGMGMIGGAITNRSAATLAQLTPIACLTADFQVVVVDANSPVRDMKDLMARFKANPGSISWGGGRAGGADHLLVGQLAREAGIPPGKVTYVPLTAGAGTIAVTAAPLQAYLSGVNAATGAAAAILNKTPVPGAAGPGLSVGVGEASVLAQPIRSGEVRALGISSPTRIGATVSLKEQGVNVELVSWQGIFGAPGITKEQQAALIAAVDAGTKQRSWQESLQRRNATAYWLAGDQFGTYVQSETRRIGDILGDLSLGKR
jgi:putative tricarboxylic transport membrane protein